MKPTKLIRAAQLGNIKQLVVALKSGIDPNSCDDQGWTPMHWAAQEGHTAIIELLISAGADLNVVDKEGFSPLLLAVGEGHTELVRQLIISGANVNQKCKAHKKGTPLHLACAWNRLEIAKELISAGAEVNTEDLAGRSPTFFAVMYGRKKLVKYLLEHGAIVDLNKKDFEEHKTILDLAKEVNDPAIIELLTRNAKKR